MAKIGRNEENQAVIIPENDEELSSINEKIAASSPLEDDELGNVSGGIEISTINHWWGDSYLVCGTCKSKDFDIIGFVRTNVIKTKCKKCNRISEVDLSRMAW